jgi:hypothetical protein
MQVDTFMAEFGAAMGCMKEKQGMTEKEIAAVRADFAQKLKESMRLAQAQAEKKRTENFGDSGKFGRWVCGSCNAPIKDMGASKEEAALPGYWAPKKIQGGLVPISEREKELRGRMGQVLVVIY